MATPPASFAPGLTASNSNSELSLPNASELSPLPWLQRTESLITKTTAPSFSIQPGPGARGGQVMRSFGKTMQNGILTLTITTWLSAKRALIKDHIRLNAMPGEEFQRLCMELAELSRVCYGKSHRTTTIKLIKKLLVRPKSSFPPFQTLQLFAGYGLFRELYVNMDPTADIHFEIHRILVENIPDVEAWNLLVLHLRACSVNPSVIKSLALSPAAHVLESGSTPDNHPSALSGSSKIAFLQLLRECAEDENPIPYLCLIIATLSFLNDDILCRLPCLLCSVVNKDVSFHRDCAVEVIEYTDNQDLKILILGTAYSGKSTVVKHMRYLSGRTRFTPEEIEEYRGLIFKHLFQDLADVLESIPPFEIQPDLKGLLKDPPSLRAGEPFPQAYYHILLNIWNNPDVQASYKKSPDDGSSANLEYFFGDLGRLFQQDYTPTSMDILNCYAPTSTPKTTELKDEKRIIHMVEVGGASSERHKWARCYQAENPGVTQMHDSLELWQSICNSAWFRNTSMILLLNKFDLFTQKIEHSNIKKVFPDYGGDPLDPHEGSEYILQYFQSGKAMTLSSRREIHTFITTAKADDSLWVDITNALGDTVLREHLRLAGLL